ncbi:hypothetical protein TWF506_001294 [Arthrobotrys conoides]|uniref:Phosphoglycerate mutase-like protein n=1 Tax=Arthrobotrys conoides TaxID=74498 RepID=A0AAN8P9N0_9PEZI
MGRPRLIILIRHAQSEGNQNKAIHQTIPDHRVKLTQFGHEQARAAGHRLKDILLPSDTLQIYTSPYRRTRETTANIVESLGDDWKEKTTVYEEPRIREQVWKLPRMLGISRENMAGKSCLWSLLLPNP